MKTLFVSPTRPSSSRLRLGLMPGLLALLLGPVACTKEEPSEPPADAGVKEPAKDATDGAPKDAVAPDSAAKDASAKDPAAAGTATASSAVQFGPWAPLTAPKPVTGGRADSPTVLAQFTGNALVPIATRRGDVWAPEEVLTLDKLPEGKMGKDAAPEVLVAWWNRLDIQADDTFILQGAKGARGTFKVKRELISADRGGCMGLVIAIPGEVKWTVKPTGSTTGANGDAPEEQVWAVRAPFTPNTIGINRELTEPENAGAKKLLESIRGIVKAAQPALPDGATFAECDSLNEPTCKGRRVGFNVLDLEANGSPEMLATLQLRPSNSNGLIETRVLISLTGDKASLLGRWDGFTKNGNEDNLPPLFVGGVDITGDGRAELIFRTISNETENWAILQAGDKPGEWRQLVKTNYEGC